MDEDIQGKCSAFSSDADIAVHRRRWGSRQMKISKSLATVYLLFAAGLFLLLGSFLGKDLRLGRKSPLPDCSPCMSHLARLLPNPASQFLFTPSHSSAKKTGNTARRHKICGSR